MTWTDKLVGSKEDRAVSPVIGVILMVAITVILAAVIAAFVMDIGPGSSSVTAGVDVTGDTVEVVDGGDASHIVAVNDGGTIVDSMEAKSGNSDTICGTSGANTIYAVQADSPGSSGTLDDKTDAATQIGTC